MLNESSLRSKMQKVMNLVASDIASIRTGRATPTLVEDIEINAYGGTQSLMVKELSTISAPDNQTILIEPWDKSIIGEIKQGILEAKIGLNPSIDGEIIRISLPPLTTEDREKFVRLLSTKLENGRVMVRQIRAEALKDIRKSFEEKEIGEDDKFNQEKRLQEVTDEFIEKINEAGENKKKQLLQI